MRVLIHPADTGACGHYRLIWPSRALQDAGYDVLCGDPELAPEDWPEEQKVYGVYTRDEFGDDRLLKVHKPPDADVFVVQRPLGAGVADLLEKLRDTNVATVVELDDDFTSIHPQNISFWAVHPGAHPRRSVKHILRACEAADLVTVSTPALQKAYSKHITTPIVVIPNFVPSWYLTTEKAGLDQRPEGLLLGWSGSLETHPTDLQAVGGAVSQILREYHHVHLTIVGTAKGVHRAFGIAGSTPIMKTGWIPLKQYPSVMKELDVGMVPLEMSTFNQGKSYLKGLEWASLGVPFVATPTEQYKWLKAGVLAHNPREWRNRLRMLITNDEYRQQIAADGRLTATQLVIEDHIERWWSAWQLARNTKSRSRVLSKTGRSPVS